MKAIYRTHFEVRSKQPNGDLANALADVCWRWALDPRRGFPHSTTIPSGCSVLKRTETAGHATAEAVVVSEADTVRWGLKLNHPDTHDAAGVWQTELGVEKAASGQVFFSCSLYIGRRDGSLAPFRRSVTRPRVVLDVLKNFHGYGALPLSSRALALKPDERYIKALLSLLQDQRRQHPIVYVSLHEQSKTFFFDLNRLAEHLAGTAYVVAAASVEADELLKKSLPVHLQAYDGAVRLYWPGFSFHSRAFDHPLWTTYRIMAIQSRSRDAFSKKLLADIAAVAATGMPERMLNWAKVEEHLRHRAIRRAKTIEDNTELLKLYEEENSDLRARITSIQSELQAKGEELYRAQARIAALENTKTALGDGEVFAPVETVADAIEQATTRWGGQLVFALNSKSDGDDSPFQPADEALRAFEWLATTYQPAKSGKKRVMNLDTSLREAVSGWNYSAKQSEQTASKYKEWYRCQCDGRNYEVHEHIGCGSSTRPEETIRIAFAFDEHLKKVVIGFVGQHQKSTQS